MKSQATLFHTLEQAQSVQMANQEEDHEWTYIVLPRGKYWVCKLFDEFGSPVGYI